MFIPHFNNQSLNKPENRAQNIFKSEKFCIGYTAVKKYIFLVVDYW